ncbi:MAG: DMT family transporter [Desulfobacteraceae bacterium]|nr:MAG: DMT family transporter [Desulfobacteraceae bacterium]
MIPISLSIAACLGWGVADFIGGFKSRRIPVMSILLVSSWTGAVMFGMLVIVTGARLPQNPGVFWAVPAGICGILAMFFLYRGLARGTMSVIAPISATGVIIPVIFGLLCGEPLTLLSLAGIVIAVIGSTLAAIENHQEADRQRLTRGVGLAVASAVFIGLYFIFMDSAATHDPLWASLCMRLSNLAALALVFLSGRSKGSVGWPPRSHLHWIILMGALDTLAAYAFVLATSKGLLSEVAVISSLYPAVTITLSTVILRERISHTQKSGIILALVGVVLISAF